ncbi:hypothetical protein PV327_005196 [Microctonus hyperodae]|uniref:Uncharacterized protein n=1 Tax=Microctonus hyperodae TaxID=165561 RepID=A0AA39G0V7_MICHY|nr:hypothetical protein PV327_005196 [Microctonus hyperodae]
MQRLNTSVRMGEVAVSSLLINGGMESGSMECALAIVIKIKRFCIEHCPVLRMFAHSGSSCVPKTFSKLH